MTTHHRKSSVINSNLFSAATFKRTLYKLLKLLIYSTCFCFTFTLHTIQLSDEEKMQYW